MKKKAWNMVSVVLLILVGYFIAEFIFVLGVNHGRELERNIGVIKNEDVDQMELQRWEYLYVPCAVKEVVQHVTVQNPRN